MPRVLAIRISLIRAHRRTKPEVKAAFANTGDVISPQGPADFGAFIQSEIAKWAVPGETGGAAAGI